MTFNWLIIEISDARGKVTYRNSFITDLDFDPENVAELAADTTDGSLPSFACTTRDLCAEAKPTRSMA